MSFVVGGIAAVVVLLLLTLALATMSARSTKAPTASGNAASSRTWVSYSTPDATLRFSLPSQPEVATGNPQSQVRTSRYVAENFEGTFGVATYDFNQGFGGVATENWFNSMPSEFASTVNGKVDRSSRTDIKGKPAIRYEVSTDEGRWYVANIFLGTRLIEMWVQGPASAAADIDHIVGSLELLDPNAPAPETTATT